MMAFIIASWLALNFTINRKKEENNGNSNSKNDSLNLNKEEQ